MKSLLAGKTAVVTGAGSGIGSALAAALVSAGAQVAVTDISQETARAVASSIGEGARAYRCDVTDRTDLASLAEAVARDLGDPAFVFANAGIYYGGALPDLDPADFDWVFDVNVRGVFNTIQAFMPQLLASAASGHKPRIIITGSENSLGLPEGTTSTAYVASKHALLGLADGLRRDLKDAGVGVSLLCPGAVNTRLWESLRWRQDRHGGSGEIPAEHAEFATKIMAEVGQDPALTARICLEGMAAGEFLITTDPRIRPVAVPRNREIETALDRLDARMAEIDRET